VAGAVEAHLQGDVGGRPPAAHQEFPRPLQSPGHPITMRAHPEGRLEGAREVEARHVRLGRPPLQASGLAQGGLHRVPGPQQAAVHLQPVGPAQALQGLGLLAHPVLGPQQAGQQLQATLLQCFAVQVGHRPAEVLRGADQFTRSGKDRFQQFHRAGGVPARTLGRPRSAGIQAPGHLRGQVAPEGDAEGLDRLAGFDDRGILVPLVDHQEGALADLLQPPIQLEGLASTDHALQREGLGPTGEDPPGAGEGREQQPLWRRGEEIKASRGCRLTSGRVPFRGLTRACQGPGAMKVGPFVTQVHRTVSVHQQRQEHPCLPSPGRPMPSGWGDWSPCGLTRPRSLRAWTASTGKPGPATPAYHADMKRC